MAGGGLPRAAGLVRDGAGVGADLNRCFVCHGTGHWARECTSLPRMYLKDDAPRCYRCDGVGHFARFCPSLDIRGVARADGASLAPAAEHRPEPRLLEMPRPVAALPFFLLGEELAPEGPEILFIRPSRAACELDDVAD